MSPSRRAERPSDGASYKSGGRRPINGELAPLARLARLASQLLDDQHGWAILGRESPTTVVRQR